jgi:hypothetical protein
MPRRENDQGKVVVPRDREARTMYQFSRSIYRELASDVSSGRNGDVCRERQRFLRACEVAMERLALDRHYFAKPVRTLFRDVREFFPITHQMRVYRVIERHVVLATEYVEQQAREGVTFDGSPLCCHASTRKGTPCQRMPLPGSKYCPSHKHLEEEFEVAAA